MVTFARAEKKLKHTKAKPTKVVVANFFFVWLLVPISFPVFEFWRQKFSAANDCGAKCFTFTYLQIMASFARSEKKLCHKKQILLKLLLSNSLNFGGKIFTFFFLFAGHGRFRTG